jgi:soluble lytic murein transglycosylase-like protein
MGMSDGILAYDMNALLEALRQVESSGRSDAVSSAGAVGDMQQMRKTLMKPGYDIPSIFEVAQMYGMTPEQTQESALALARDPEIARRFAYEYLDKSQREVGNNMDQLIGSYNAGISGVRGRSVPEFLYEETRNYVPKVRAAYKEMTGTELPERGYYGAPIYQTKRPRRRPEGLLGMQ